MDVISNYIVKKAPPHVYYIPNFISVQEEEDIMRNVYSAPKPKWTYLSNRRLQDYGGVPHEKGMIPEKMPTWLQKYLDKITVLNVFKDNKPNQVLVNEYLPGQGIMPHSDGPLFYPTITTISCGSHTVLRFLENDVDRQQVCDIFLERCSLLVLKDDMYSKYLHTIAETNCDILEEYCVNLENCFGQYKVGEKLDRQTRVSVTIRNVPKVLKIRLLK